MTSRVAVVVAVLALVLPARADLLVYEGFDYFPGSGLANASGGSGFEPSSTWNASATSGNGSGFVQVHPANSFSGVYLNNGGTLNPFTGTYANLPQTGNHVGPNNGGLGSTSLAPGVADHIYLYRMLAPAVTQTFQNGTKTYFSFVSARAYNANPRAPSLGIGSGIFSQTAVNDRGDSVVPGPGNANAEVIAVGGLTTSVTPAGLSTATPVGTLNASGAPPSPTTVFSNFAFFRAQYYNAAGLRTGWSRAVGTAGNGVNGEDLLGTAITSSPASEAAAGNNGYWSGGGLTYYPFTNPSGAPNTSSTSGFALYGYNGSLLANNAAFGDNEALVNVTVGEIAWGADTDGTDLVSFYVFHDKDVPSQAAFDAGKMTWDTGADTSARRSQFNYLTMGGGRYFADEIRVATTFNEAVGQLPVPEAGTGVLLAAAGLAALAVGSGRRRPGDMR